MLKRKKAEKAVNFPKWRKVIPDKPDDKIDLDIKTTGFSKKPEKCESISLLLYSIMQSTGKIVNLRYLIDLIPGKWKLASSEGSESPLVFEHRGDNAVYTAAK